MTKAQTDWDSYYAKPFPLARFSRYYSERRLLTALAASNHTDKSPFIIELGGANSCFYDAVRSSLRPSKYVVVDYNASGLRYFSECRARDIANESAEAIQSDLLLDGLPSKLLGTADICFSVGLIEHFDTVGTAKIVAEHFRAVKPGGLVVMSFPTPTWLYRTTRKAAELLGLWKFPDERPLQFDEVLRTLPDTYELLDKFVVWPIFLTQGYVVARTRYQDKIS